MKKSLLIIACVMVALVGYAGERKAKKENINSKIANDMTLYDFMVLDTKKQPVSLDRKSVV